MRPKFRFRASKRVFGGHFFDCGQLLIADIGMRAYNMSYDLPTVSIFSMDFISIRDFRTQPGKIWEKLAGNQQLVVTRNGKPFAILTETSPTDLEADLQSLRRARFGRALSAIRTEAQKKGLDKLSSAQINDLIRDTREACRDKSGS